MSDLVVVGQDEFKVNLSEDPIVVAVENDSLVVASLGEQGPPGPSGAAPGGKVFTRDLADRIIRIDYSDGTAKAITYDDAHGGRVDYIDVINGAVTKRRQFVWAGALLQRIDETTI